MSRQEKLRLREMITGFWVSQSIYVAAKLGIADHLLAGPKRADELAQLAGVKAGPLYRVLRALSSRGLFAEKADGRFELTSTGELLATNTPGSLRHYAIMMGEEQYAAFTQLLDAVKSGGSVFEKVFGEPFFPYMQRHAETLKTFQLMKGVLFDLPEVTEKAKAAVAEAAMTDRCGIEAGDFFAAVPEGGDAYLLKYILHDWDDEHSRKILQTVHRAMNGRGKLLIVEAVIPAGNQPFFSKFADLHMLVLLDGKERSEMEFRALLGSAGFTIDRIVPTNYVMSVIEASPAR
jgi:hypothetical protein